MNQLIIPMLVEAYATGSKNTTQKRVPLITPEFYKHRTVLGSRCTPAIDSTIEPLKGGVHLHFVLPDCFTHSKDGVDYPVVPNRYIVTRVLQNRPGDKISSKCWVIESDFTSTNNKKYPNSVSFPVSIDPKNGMKYVRVGRTYPAGPPPSPEKEDGRLDKLTALGPGNPYFAAYYPDCKSVFGFYDDLNDNKTPIPALTKLTYFVMGYYAQADKDPFSAVKTEEDFVKALAERKLSVQNTKAICDSSVFFGAIDCIEWKGFDPLNEYYDVPKGKVFVTVGNTSAESLSYAIKEAVKKQLDVPERFFTELQYELQDELQKRDGNFKVDDEILAQSFSIHDGLDENLHFSVEKETKLNPKDNLGTPFSELKMLGRKIGDLRRKLLFEQKKLFSVWEQYVYHFEDSKHPPLYPLRADMLKEIQAICAKNDELSKNLVEATALFEVRLSAYSSTLPSGVLCEKSASEPFFAVKDPVLLLSGDGVKRSYAFGEDGRFNKGGTLMCQTEAIRSNVSKENLLNTCFSDLSYMTSLPSSYGDLLSQTVLACTEALKSVKSLMGEIQVIGTIPDGPAINKTPFNWSTLYMLWQADYMPTHTESNPDNTLMDWNLDYGHTTLVYNQKLTPIPNKMSGIWGRTVPIPYAVKALAGCLERYGDTRGKPEYQKLAKDIKEFSIISQSLGGFSDYFSSFQQAWQFPITGIGDSEQLTKAVAERVGKERHSILHSNDPLPMRGGFVRISKLSLVSSFGRRQMLEVETSQNDCEVNFAETVRSSHKGYGLFPPAFAVPGRLTVDYVSAADKNVLSSPAPETTPVCGIVVPELLNNRLLAFTGDGLYLGMVKTVFRNGKHTARWLSAPELDPEFEKLQMDPNLKSFLRVLFSAENAFYELNGLMRQYLKNKQNDSALIWARPLVLARVKADFLFYGSPEFSKKLEDFQKYNTFGAEQIRFSMGMGDINRISDGLLGCFSDNDFSRLYPPFGAHNPLNTESYIAYQKTLQVSGADHTAYYTFLVEPGSPVNIQTGILPVKSVCFEATHTKILENLSLSAEVSPILASMEKVGLPPLPRSEGETPYQLYVPCKEAYIKNKIISPSVSFEETVLMDGLVVKDGQ